MTGRNLIYVADGSRVIVFPAKGRHLRSIGMTPGFEYVYGLSVDHDRDLYVSDPRSRRLFALHPGSTKPYIAYLAAGLYSASYHERVVAGTAGHDIIEFRKGHPLARRLLHGFGIEVDGLAFDASGNLYAAYRRSDSPGDAGIEMFAPGTEKGADLSVALTAPQGLAVDAAGDILVAETQGIDRIDVFHPGQTTPYRRRHVANVPTEIQFDRVDGALYISSLDNRIYKTAYPQLRRPHVRIYRDLTPGVQGVAVSAR
jgi:sugar lactone lactonase YvrE